MALQNIVGLGQGGAGLIDKLPAAVKELQGLTVSVVSGAAANTNIPVTGIATEDTLVGVIEIPTAAVMVDRKATTSITSAGNIQCTAVTTGNQLLVIWFNKQ